MNLVFLKSYWVFNVSPDISTLSSSQIGPSSYVYMKRLYTVLPHFNDKSPTSQMAIILYLCITSIKHGSVLDFPVSKPSKERFRTWFHKSNHWEQWRPLFPHPLLAEVSIPVISHVITSLYYCSSCGQILSNNWTHHIIVKMKKCHFFVPI